MTTTSRHLFAFSAAFTLLLALAAPALGVVEPPEEAPTESELPLGDAPEPAIPIPDDPSADETPEWSYRFLVPATMVLGTIAVVGTIFMYFVRVTKNRYRVVE